LVVFGNRKKYLSLLSASKAIGQKEARILDREKAASSLTAVSVLQMKLSV